MPKPSKHEVKQGRSPLAPQHQPVPARGLLQPAFLPGSQTHHAAASAKQGNWDKVGFAKLDWPGCSLEAGACHQQHLILGCTAESS